MIKLTRNNKLLGWFYSKAASMAADLWYKAVISHIKKMNIINEIQSPGSLSLCWRKGLTLWQIAHNVFWLLRDGRRKIFSHLLERMRVAETNWSVSSRGRRMWSTQKKSPEFWHSWWHSKYTFGFFFKRPVSFGKQSVCASFWRMWWMSGSGAAGASLSGYSNNQKRDDLFSYLCML